MIKPRRSRRSRPFTEKIACEFCPKTIGGGNVAGLFANYNSHCLSAHPYPAPYYVAPRDKMERVR